MTFRTRFAPSPTGPLHLGHAYSAMLAADLASAAGGEFLLRIEDIDVSRARPAWEAQIYDDLSWLGLTWPLPVIRQSERIRDYQLALERLWSAGLLYACTCSRRDIAEALSAPQEGVTPVFGPDGPIYPGTCRGKGRPAGSAQDAAVRLNMGKAVALVGPTLMFDEQGHGPSGETGPITLETALFPDQIGDIVLARRDMGTSYHLSVVVDDAAQEITHVVRGQDLFDATAIHVLLQKLLDLPTPRYHHHRLIRDDAGKRLAKRDDSRAISLYRKEGATPQDIRRMVGV